MMLKTWRRLCVGSRCRSGREGVLNRSSWRFTETSNGGIASIKVSPSTRSRHRVAAGLSATIRRSRRRRRDMGQRRSIDDCCRRRLAEACMSICVMTLGTIGFGCVIVGLVHIGATPWVIFRVVHSWSKLLGLLLRRRSLLLLRLRRIVFGRRLRRFRRKFSNWRQDGLCSETGELGLRKACDGNELLAASSSVPTRHWGDMPALL